jgi:amino acid permease
MLICYGLVGIIVYITLLLLGEMATQYPVAGESQRAFHAKSPLLKHTRLL